MRVSATAKYIRGSTRKTHLITRSIIGKRVEEAAAALRFMPQHAARDVAAVLKSATANAENNHDLDVDSLVVSEASVGKNLTIKRFHARARGRGARIEKPFSQITIVVEERE